MVDTPIEKVDPLAKPAVLITLTEGQLSVAVGVA